MIAIQHEFLSSPHGLQLTEAIPEVYPAILTALSHYRRMVGQMLRRVTTVEHKPIGKLPY
jgi:hypothetical protein